MSVLAVTRNDVRESLRSKGPWVLTAGFLLGFIGLAYAIAELAEPDFELYLDATSAIIALLLPLVGVILGYQAIITERESGTIALLMSLPHSRGDMVAGKFLGRVTVFSVAFLVGAFGGGLFVVVQYTSFDPARYLLFILTALVYGLAFVAIATALSMALSTSRRVIGAAFGLYVLSVLLWNQIVNIVVVILFRFRPRALVDLPLWAESAKFLNPRTTFVYLVGEWLDIGGGPSELVVDSQWFAAPAVAVVVLFGWIVVPPLIAYFPFDRMEF
jgi:ABC-2 type transport system permease protein